MYAVTHVSISLSSMEICCKNHLLDAKVQLRELLTSTSKCCNLGVKWQRSNYRDQVKYLPQCLRAISLETFAVGTVTRQRGSGYSEPGCKDPAACGSGPSSAVICRRETHNLRVQNAQGALQAKETGNSLWSCLNISERWPDFRGLITFSHERARSEGTGKDKENENKWTFSRTTGCYYLWTCKRIRAEIIRQNKRF